MSELLYHHDITQTPFVARLITATKMGLFRPTVLAVLKRWADAMMRLEGGQLGTFLQHLTIEAERLSNFSVYRTLGNDPDGYDALRLLALLTHPCQQCATDPDAWHTRWAFCQHKKEDA
jgi:hypothetical protein